MRTLIYCLIAGSLFFNNVWADHEPDHRYNIRGYVLNAKQQGIDAIPVQAFAQGDAYLLLEEHYRKLARL